MYTKEDLTRHALESSSPGQANFKVVCKAWLEQKFPAATEGDINNFVKNFFAKSRQKWKEVNGKKARYLAEKVAKDDFFKNEIDLSFKTPEKPTQRVLTSTPNSDTLDRSIWSEVNDSTLGLADDPSPQSPPTPKPPPLPPISSEASFSEPEQSDSGISLNFDSSSESCSTSKNPSPPSKTAPKRPLTVSDMPWLSEKNLPAKKLKVEEEKEPVSSSDAFDFVKAFMKQRGGENL